MLKSIAQAILLSLAFAAQANASGELRPVARPQQIGVASDAEAAAILAEVYTTESGLSVQTWNKLGDDTWYIMLENQPK